MSTEENKVLVRQFYERAWNEKDLAFVDENAASDYVDHTPGTPPGLPSGREGIKLSCQPTLPHFLTSISPLKRCLPKAIRW